MQIDLQCGLHMSNSVLTLLCGGFRHVKLNEWEEIGRASGPELANCLEYYVIDLIHTLPEYTDDVEARASTRA